MGKLSDAQTADVIKITAVAPTARSDRVSQGREQLHGNVSKDSLMQDWGVNIDTKMKEVQARILPPPTISGFDYAEIRPQNGAFDFSKIREKFFKPVCHLRLKSI